MFPVETNILIAGILLLAGNHTEYASCRHERCDFTREKSVAIHISNY